MTVFDSDEFSETFIVNSGRKKKKIKTHIKLNFKACFAPAFYFFCLKALLSFSMYFDLKYRSVLFWCSFSKNKLIRPGHWQKNVITFKRRWGFFCSVESFYLQLLSIHVYSSFTFFPSTLLCPVTGQCKQRLLEHAVFVLLLVYFLRQLHVQSP